MKKSLLIITLVIGILVGSALSFAIMQNKGPSETPAKEEKVEKQTEVIQVARSQEKQEEEPPQKLSINWVEYEDENLKFTYPETLYPLDLFRDYDFIYTEYKDMEWIVSEPDPVKNLFLDLQRGVLYMRSTPCMNDMFCPPEYSFEVFNGEMNKDKTKWNYDEKLEYIHAAMPGPESDYGDPFREISLDEYEIGIFNDVPIILGNESSITMDYYIFKPKMVTDKWLILSVCTEPEYYIDEYLKEILLPSIEIKN